ncbi:hypothetical protein AOL_s00004g541 [Orbilia oligospora ATCC 24927]|uniref:Fungal-type protein kinase domain-containing protein n=1 Tax=Arthrobotrys oligospora (strain ATCC 24927 / CBS 115.81 / DSM 1491) TaxID=756982 RepID=G1WZ30_ARTOA|nr:hypothetical protein AOL_s00004g541 [Orbilia oligospora ATCC 24927]EGX53882.1 hypothetical protein AOL_s00004g541 [Orbilia oligospora ATCC 24927]
MQLSEFLEAIAAPQLITCRPLSTTKTNNLVHPREHLPDLTEWTGIKRDIKKLLDPKLSFELAEPGWSDFIRTDTGRATSCSDENGVSALGTKAYENPALVILEECFGIVGRFCYHGVGCDLGDADRVFVIQPNPRERGKGKFVLEWEAPWALDTPDNLIEEFNSGRLSNGRPTKLVKAVSQLYGYMTFNNMRIGALCNYESLYLFQRVGSCGFQVSPPFKFSDRGTESPVAALVYICHQVVTVGSFHHSPIEQGPPGTHMLNIEDFVVRGTWKENGNTEILWEQIHLYLAERVTGNRRSCLKFTKRILKSRRKLLTKT